MKITKIDHISIATRDIEKFTKLFLELFGIEFGSISDLPSQKVKICFSRSKDANLEVISPLTEDSPVAKFLEKRGEGLHHICLEVENIEEALKELKQKKINLIDEKPIIGGYGKKVAFIHPKSTEGVLVELKEK